MKFLKVLNTKRVRKDTWNEFLLKCDDWNILQTYEWAVVLKSLGYTPNFIIIENRESRIIGGLLYFKRYIPEMSFNRFLSERFFSVFYSQGGPLTLDSARYQDVFNSILLELDKSAKNQNVLSLTLHSFPLEKKIRGKSYLENLKFQKSFFCDLVVDLSPEIDFIWKNIESRGRKFVRQAIKRGAKVIEALSIKELKIFYKLHKLTFIRNNLIPTPYVFFEKLWKLFKPKNMIKIFFTLYNGKIIASLLLLLFRRKIWAYSANSLSEFSKIRPNDILFWHAIKWGKENDYLSLNLGGVACRPQKGTKEFNLYMFKKKWKGKLVFYPRYYKAYSKIRKYFGSTLSKSKVVSFLRKYS